MASGAYAGTTRLSPPAIVSFALYAAILAPRARWIFAAISR